VYCVCSVCSVCVACVYACMCVKAHYTWQMAVPHSGTTTLQASTQPHTTHYTCIHYKHTCTTHAQRITHTTSVQAAPTCKHRQCAHIWISVYICCMLDFLSICFSRFVWEKIAYHTYIHCNYGIYTVSMIHVAIYIGIMSTYIHSLQTHTHYTYTHTTTRCHPHKCNVTDIHSLQTHTHTHTHTHLPTLGLDNCEQCYQDAPWGKVHLRAV
jgi:hypothetical protein